MFFCSILNFYVLRSKYP